MRMKKTSHSSGTYFAHHYTIDGHSAAIYALTRSSDHIYSSSGDKYVVRWDIKNGSQDSFAIKLEKPSYAIHFIEESNTLIVGGSDGRLNLFDVISKKEIRCFTQHRNAIFSIEKNLDRNHIYVGDQEGYLSIWDNKTWELQMMIHLNCGKIRAMFYSSSEKLLFVGKQNGEISIFETEYYNELKTFKANDNGVSSLLFCEKRKLLASGGNDARIRIYNLNGEQLKSIPAHHYTIYSLLDMNDDVSISASRDRSIKVWKGFYEKVIQKIDHKSQGHNFSVNTLIKINEHSFSSGGDDTKIIVFKEN